MTTNRKKLVVVLGTIACACCVAVFFSLFAQDASNLSPSSIAPSEIGGASGNDAMQLSQADYEERMAVSKEMATSVGKPVSTQGVLSSLDRNGMGSVDASNEGITYMTGQVLVLFSDDASLDSAKNALAKYGLSADDQHIQDCLNSQAPVLALTEYGKSVANVLDAIRGDTSESAIKFAQPNFIYELAKEIEPMESATAGTPVEKTSEHPLSAYSSKLNINDPRFRPWNIRTYEEIHIQEAWGLAQTNGKVAVAVLDNGVVDHPDLIDNIIPGTGYNGYYDNSEYQGTKAGSCVDTDHGTHVAGIVAAGANNEIGTAGLSYNARIIPIDVSVAIGNQKHITEWAVANSLAYLAVDSDLNGKSDMVEKYNLRVINMSLGSRNYSSDAWNETYKRLVFPYIDMLYEQGVLTVCAAGNDGIQNDGLYNATVPADYDKCMSVINANTYGENTPSRSSDSNYGSLKDISAPGNCITSTTYSFDKNTGAINYNYGESWGTSMASPAVAGIAALVFSVNPDLTPAQVQDILQSTATSSNGIPSFDIQLGWGLVNAEAAVIKAKETTGGNTAIHINLPTAETGLVYNGSTQTGVASGEGYDVRYGMAKNAGSYTAVVTPKSGYAWNDGSTTEKSVTFNIAPATLTATYAGERIAAGAMPAYNVSVSGFVAGEGPENAAGYVAPRVVPPAKLEPGSSYSLIPSGGSAANYEFNYVGGMLEVAPLIAEQPPSVSVDYAAEALIGFAPNAKYIIDNSEYIASGVTATGASIPIQNSWFGKRISIAKVGDSITTSNSPAVFVDVPARPSIPANQLVVENETIQGMSDGRITGVSQNMEYRMASASLWAECPNGSIESLSPGDYEIRLRATNFSFAGNIVKISIGVGAERTCVLSIADIHFDPVVYGYDEESLKQLEITNTGNSTAKIERIELKGIDATTFDLLGDISEVAPKETNKSLSIMVRTGLNVGEYKAVVMITYNDGKTAFGNMNFKVLQKPLEAPDVYIDYKTEMFNGLISDKTYLLNQREYVAQNNQLPILSEMFGNTVFIAEKSKNANYCDSAAKQVTVPKRPDAPSIETRDESVPNMGDGAILGTTSKMEYRAAGVDGGSSGGSSTEWIACSEGNTESLLPGDYEIRLCATNESFAGCITTVHINAGVVKPTCILSISDTQCTPAVYGYGPQNPVQLSITNTGNSVALIKNVTLEGEGANTDAFHLEGTLSKVNPGESVSQLSVVPREGLGVGNYSADVVVTYTGENHDEKKVSGNVSFQVSPKAMDKPDVRIDYMAEAFSGLAEGTTYLFDQLEYEPKNGQVPIPSGMFGHSVSVVAKSAGANYCDSAAVQINVPMRPAAPKVGVREESVAGANDGAILDTTPEMEYRTANGGKWKQCHRGNTESLSPGNYLVRIKANESNFVSEIISVFVKEGRPTGSISSDKPNSNNQEAGNKKPVNQRSDNQEPNAQDNQDKEAASDDIVAEDFVSADTENGTDENSEIATSTVQPTKESMAAASEDSDSGVSVEWIIVAAVATLAMFSVLAAAAIIFIRIRRP